MLKYFILLAFICISFNGYSQEKSVPDGFELVSLDGKDAYLNLETGEIKLIKVDNYRAVGENKNSNANTSSFGKTHAVKKGETLYQIAKKYRTSVKELYRLNNKSDNIISIGQEIIVNADSNSSSSISNAIYKDMHIVKKGETLYSLSRKYNTSIDRLKELNQLNSNTILLNQSLKLK